MIVCGTDFSPSATRAADVAAILAQRAGTALELVCATGARESTAGTPEAALAVPTESTGERMAAETERLRSMGTSVEGTLDPSPPHHALVQRALRPETILLVLGAEGHSFLRRVLLGSVAERVAMESTKPVLVVRDDTPWRLWATDTQPLRVMVAFDPGASASTALDWVASLARWGRVELTVCWVVNPGLENQRAGATGEAAGIELLPKTRETLWREMQALIGVCGAPPSITMRLEANPGRIDSALTQLAASLEQDLLVVGSHQRRGFDRIWQQSVSRGVLHDAGMSVVVVPHLRDDQQ